MLGSGDRLQGDRAHPPALPPVNLAPFDWLFARGTPPESRNPACSQRGAHSLSLTLGLEFIIVPLFKPLPCPAVRVLPDSRKTVTATPARLAALTPTPLSFVITRQIALSYPAGSWDNKNERQHCDDLETLIVVIVLLTFELYVAPFGNHGAGSWRRRQLDDGGLLQRHVNNPFSRSLHPGGDAIFALSVLVALHHSPEYRLQARCDALLTYLQTNSTNHPHRRRMPPSRDKYRRPRTAHPRIKERTPSLEHLPTASSPHLLMAVPPSQNDYRDQAQSTSHRGLMARRLDVEAAGFPIYLPSFRAHRLLPTLRSRRRNRRHLIT